MGSKTSASSKQFARRLGHAIRRARETQKLSQDELAWRSELHRAYMGFVEQGRYDIKVVTLLQVAKGLGVKPSQILQELGQ